MSLLFSFQTATRTTTTGLLA